MITIHQIQLTSEQIDAVNSGCEVAAFQAKMASQFGKFKNSQFDFYCEAYEVDTDDLNKAFEWTNLWNNQAAVDVIGDRGYSSSVGDIFELNGEFFICASFGFEKIEGLTSKAILEAAA